MANPRSASLVVAPVLAPLSPAAFGSDVSQELSRSVEVRTVRHWHALLSPSAQIWLY